MCGLLTAVGLRKDSSKPVKFSRHVGSIATLLRKYVDSFLVIAANYKFT
jgi:hypothetical protein